MHVQVAIEALVSGGVDGCDSISTKLGQVTACSVLGIVWCMSPYTITGDHLPVMQALQLTVFWLQLFC
jgi:hypothetical protein